MGYLRDIVRYRHFWVHLALSGLRARFRRSYLGILWVALQPLLLTLIISSVLNFVFNMTFTEYSIYIFSGIIAWDFLKGCVDFGAACFLTAEGYIRQVRLPMAIYPLKALLYCAIVFTMAFAGFAIYTLLLEPSCFSWYWLYLFPFFAVLVLFGAPLAIISAIINIKFRDFQQFIGLILQIIWYMSPIFLPRNVFDKPMLRDWTAINPIAALMDIFRQPVLDGIPPDLRAYGLMLVWALGLWALSLWMLVRNERKIIFYY